MVASNLDIDTDIPLNHSVQNPVSGSGDTKMDRRETPASKGAHNPAGETDQHICSVVPEEAAAPSQ